MKYDERAAYYDGLYDMACAVDQQAIGWRLAKSLLHQCEGRDLNSDAAFAAPDPKSGTLPGNVTRAQGTGVTERHRATPNDTPTTTESTTRPGALLPSEGR